MRVFRLSRKKYAYDLSGKGAAKFGNRWNSKGVKMLYTAESRALAMAEVIVHLSLATLPDDYMMIEIDIPDSLKIEVLNPQVLDEDWNSNPPKLNTQKIGDSFIYSGDFCVLKVPSTVVNGDFNFLLNPNHSSISEIKIIEIVNFPFDERIFK
ncbi:RES family NAD+ phosphorylase [Aequorivita sp. F47161]|uniref:RES family NAD+ phosphorylase n=1 Tax=Aequorivita vitellina TaxID=2874475 RepID=A0A9X1QWV7_9FLAO|nr:RES family NAD+ phosphorylase [Aequorivita vitellina]MCG2418588.1 RES family NAD+ phosphorylase [Aequorivita vitellina]